MNRLREIEELGQSVWLDNLNRQLLDGGELERLIADDGLSGVTSNPTIFEKGMGHSDRYDDAFREALDETDDPQELFERLAYQDVRDAAELLRPTSHSSSRRRSPTTATPPWRRRAVIGTRSAARTCSSRCPAPRPGWAPSRS